MVKEINYAFRPASIGYKYKEGLYFSTWFTFLGDLYGKKRKCVNEFIERFKYKNIDPDDSFWQMRHVFEGTNLHNMLKQ